jgi:site-specific recombinase XerD
MIREDERTGKPLLTANPTRAFDWPTYQETETKFLLPDELKAFLAVELPINEAVARDLMMDTGLRVSELCRANVEDLIEIDGLWSLAVIVKGRGRRQRKIHSPVSLPVVQVLHEHLVSRKISGPTKDPLLVNQRGQRYNRHSLQYVIRKTARQAGIERFRVSPHKIRHTKNVVRRVGGIDDTTRSRLLGQTSPRSQERYDHIIPSELHAAKEKEAEGLARYLRRISESGQ